MTSDERACPHCGLSNVRVTLQTYSATFLFCDACGCAWEIDGNSSSVLPLRPMWAFMRQNDRLSMTAQTPTQLVIRSASINERQTFASPEELESFRNWFEHFLYQKGWTLIAKGIDRRADSDRRAATRLGERRILPYRARSE